MLHFYFNRITRHLWRNKHLNLLSLLSLSIGLAIFTLIFLHVKREFSHDRHWPDSQRIYKLLQHNLTGTKNISAGIPSNQTENLRSYLGERAEALTRMASTSAEIELDEDKKGLAVRLVEENFTEVFPVEVVEGSVSQVLSNPGLIAFEETTASNIFGTLDSLVGKRIRLLGGSGFSFRDGVIVPTQGQAMEFEIAAIYRLPQPVSYDTQFTVLALMHEQSLQLIPFQGSFMASAWMKTSAGVNAEEVNSLLVDYVDQYVPLPARGVKPGQTISDLQSWQLEALRDSYFYSQESVRQLRSNGGNIMRVSSFALIGVLTLIVAASNAVSLGLATSLERVEEVGILKALGARPLQVLMQYQGEAMVVCLLALLPALGLTALLHPVFAELLSINDLPALSWQDVGLLTGICLLLGLIIGFYPAWVLSAQKPAASLNGQALTLTGGFNLRTLLVGMQFTIAILLVVGTLALYTQMLMTRHQPLGFSVDNLLSIYGRVGEQGGSEQALISELSSIPGVSQVQRIVSGPSSINSDSMVGGEPQLVLNADEASGVRITQRSASYGQFSFYKIPLLAGREFSFEQDEAYLTGVMDTPESERENPIRILINETAARGLGVDDWQQLIGQQVLHRTNFNGQVRHTPYVVIGVVRDNMLFDLRSRPVAQYYYPSMHTQSAILRDNIYLGLHYDDVLADTIRDQVTGAWQQVSNNTPDFINFLEDSVANAYRNERQESRLLLICSGFTLFLSVLGLYGLVSIAMKASYKEIGVRKVLGASALTVVMMFLKRFSRPALFACLIAWPVAVYFVLQWIERFPYQLEKFWLLPICLLATTLVFVVSWLTVGALSARAASVRPVLCLRYE